MYVETQCSTREISVVHSSKSILLLGGYGNAGRAIAMACAKSLNAHLIIAGPNKEKGLTFVNTLRHTFPNNRFNFVVVDINCSTSLANACKGIDLVIVASSSARALPTIAMTAVQNGADYIDLWYSPIIASKMEKLKKTVYPTQKRVITQSGLHPGLPAVLLRYLISRLDRTISAKVTSRSRTDWSLMHFADSTQDELQEPFEHAIFSKGQWRETPHQVNGVDFGPDDGTQPACAIVFGELRKLAIKLPNLEEMSFHLHSDHNQLVGPPYFSRMRAVVKGFQKGEIVERSAVVEAADGYTLTAVSTVAVVRQLLETQNRSGEIVEAALWVDPDYFMRFLSENILSVKLCEQCCHEEIR